MNLVAEVKPVEEKVQEVKEKVKPEEPVAETKPAETVSVSHNLKYEIKDDTVTITGCDAGASGRLVIPATIEGKPVTSIGGSAFSDFSNLSSITIPNSVISIGDVAFGGCTSLTSITIPDGVTSIEGGAFFGCSSLTSITIPDGVTSIGVNAFSRCRSLTSITIGAGVTSIGGGAFSVCSSLTNITIPDSVTSIGKYAFNYCTNLTSITIPDNVTSIGDSTFVGSTSLTAVAFLGDAPKTTGNIFSNPCKVTIYRKPEARGWGDTFAGRPVKLISEKP